MSRAKVQTSVTSVTLSGLPSTTAPVLSRVTEIICDTKRTVSCAARSRASALDQIGLVDRDEARFGLLLVLLAILDRGLEAVIDLGRQQVLQRAAIAIGETPARSSRRRARASDEVARDRTSDPGRRWHRGRPPAACRARRCPSSGRPAETSAFGASGAWSITVPGSGTTLLLSWVRCATVARSPVDRRPLAAGALAEHAAQPQEDEDRQRQEDDGVDIHVASLSGSSAGNGAGGASVPSDSDLSG